MVMRRVANPVLRRFLAAPGRFAIYGTGAGGTAVADALAELGIKPYAWVDTYREGELAGLAILSPEEAVEAGLDAIVTASMYARDMAAQIRGDGWEGPVIDLTVAHQERWAGHFDCDWLDAHADAIAAARALLADDDARRLYDAVLAHRRSLDPGDLPPATPPYRHPAVPVRDGDWVLDVGAFDGETALEYAEAVGPLGRVHAFEPSGENFARLEAALETHPCGARVTAHRLGAWKAAGELAIHSEGDVPSQFQVGEDGNETIQVTSLDDFVWEHTAGRVDWIKLDVEGAEHEALEGASATIAERRPRLAVCIYHRPGDLWELPAKLHGMMPGATLHLGHHCQNLYDTVCYVRPPD